MKYHVKRHAVVQPQDQSYKIIPLTKGLNALVDTTDYANLSQWSWYAFKTRNLVYAARTNVKGQTPRQLLMHRVILGLDSPEYDHHNSNGLDNRRNNLRPCNTSQNGANRGKQINNKSGYKGVHWSKSNKGWVAQTTLRGTVTYLGTFPTKQQAFAAYSAFTVTHRGDFANLG